MDSIHVWSCSALPTALDTSRASVSASAGSSLTHAQIVSAVPATSHAPALTRSSELSKNSALSFAPAVQLAPETWPVRPLPLESAATVPNRSSSRQCATAPNCSRTNDASATALGVSPPRYARALTVAEFVSSIAPP